MANLKLNVALPDTDIDCVTAKEKFIKSDYETVEESLELMIKISSCDLINEIEKIPEHDGKRVVVYIDNDSSKGEGNHRVLFGVLDVKDAEKAAQYSKYVVQMIAGAIATVDPIRGILVNKIGEFSIDEYLIAAKSNNPLIVLYPTSIPGNRKIREVFKEISNSKVYKSITHEIHKFTEETLKHPTNLLIPSAKTVYEIVGNTFKITEYVNEAGKLVEKTLKSIEIPFVPNSFRLLNEVIKSPEKIPELIVTAPVEVIKDGLDKVKDFIKKPKRPRITI